MKIKYMIILYHTYMKNANTTKKINLNQKAW
jgi:hypothetical protein